MACSCTENDGLIKLFNTDTWYDDVNVSHELALLVWIWIETMKVKVTAVQTLACVWFDSWGLISDFTDRNLTWVWFDCWGLSDFTGRNLAWVWFDCWGLNYTSFLHVSDLGHIEYPPLWTATRFPLLLSIMRDWDLNHCTQWRTLLKHRGCRLLVSLFLYKHTFW